MANEEKIMNEVIDTENYEGYDYDEYSEESGGGLGKVVVGLVGSTVLAGATALAVRNRDRISDWKLKRKIKKLESEGYTVVYPEDVEVEVIESDSEEVKKESKK